mgnify:CR=1 FL=1
MITEFQIFESKQVGILYHLTDNLYNLKNILEDDEMKSRYDYISFSRNKNFNFRYRLIKIIFNGNQMSNNFKFQPYSYGGGNKMYNDEYEERIFCNKKSQQQKEDERAGRNKHFDCIKGIKKYIIGIEINKDYLDDDVFNKKFHLLKEIQESIPNIKIKLV